MKYFIILILSFNVTLFGGSWMRMPLDVDVSAAHVIITGEVESLSSDIGESYKLNGKLVTGVYRLNYIRVTEVLKNDLEDLEIQKGDLLPLRVSGSRSGISTSFAFAPKRSGIWLLQMSYKHFRLPNPLHRLEYDKLDAVKKCLLELPKDLERAHQNYITQNKQAFKNLSTTGSLTAESIKSFEDKVGFEEEPSFDTVPIRVTAETGKPSSVFVDSEGVIVGYLPYEVFGSFLQEGVIRVELSGEEGKGYNYSNSKGELLSNKSYDFVYPFSNGLGRVSKNGLYGYIDSKGKEIIPLKYSYATDFSLDIAHVKYDGESLLIDKYGKSLLAFRLNEKDTGSFSSGLLYVTERGDFQSGYLGADSRMKIYDDKDYSIGRRFVNGVSKVKQNNNFGAIDLKGKLIIPVKYCELGDFSNGLAFFRNDYTEPYYGYVNTKGEEVISPQFLLPSSFNKGYASVSKAVWEERRKIENPKFNFKKSSLAYEKRVRTGLIDTKGETVFPFILSSAIIYDSGRISVSFNKEGRYFSCEMTQKGKILKVTSTQIINHEREELSESVLFEVLLALGSLSLLLFFLKRRIC
ncbi:MAG: WG repeat-containing protein [Lentisphaeraceae bacterium]|nr:WG repeat-containing protein [Lentisphaeraceae bacterium]